MSLKKMFAMQALVFSYLCVFAGIGYAEESKVAGDTGAQAVAKSEPVLDYIAIVNGKKIHMRDYVSELRNGIKKKFYHGKPPADELKQFRKEVAEDLVERTLLIEEAKRRGLQPDSALVESTLKRYDAGFKDDPEWPKARDEVLSIVREKIEGDSLEAKLEAAVHEVPEPTEAMVRDYYQKHPDLFTTPEKVKVSMILLKVDPSSPSEVWAQANKEAAEIIERLNAGGDFAELARIHSSDQSAANGGDMGYIHSGMLGQNAQEVLNIMEPGELSAPVVLLEGVAIFRLAARDKAHLNKFEDVKERAAKLYQRDAGEKSWSDLLLSLKGKAKIEYNDAPWR